MKSLAKQRKEQQERDERDEAAFNILLWFIAKVLSLPPWKWGAKRLQRVYDAGLDFMNEHRNNLAIGPELKRWAESVGLTEEAYIERKVAKANGNHS